jgi:hypothetical protein
MRRREFNKGLAAATAVVLSPFPRIRNASAATGMTPVINFPDFSGSPSSIHLADAATFSGNVINLLNNQGHNHGSAWYTIQQAPTAFTTVFTWTPSGLGSSVEQSGMTFCIQNSSGGINAAGDANMCGYSGAENQGPPYNSIAIKFDAGSASIGRGYPAGKLPSATGLYLNGGPAAYPGSSIGLVPYNDLSPTGINFYNVHTFQVTIVYDGTLLTMVILDTTTNAQARLVWPLNLANTTNATGNYVGFTAGTASQGVLTLNSWSYSTGYNTRLATPTFSPTPGNYTSTQAVTISYPPGSTCYYTTNGLLPTSSSTQYTGPITVSANEVIQAVAIQSNFTDSLVATGNYIIGASSNAINFPNGFSAGNLIPVGFAYQSGTTYRVTDTTQGCAGAVWFPAPVTVSTFSTTFTLIWGGGGQGMCFVIQNTPVYTSPTNSNSAVPSTQFGQGNGPTVLGASGNALGYGGMDAFNGHPNQGDGFGLNASVAIAFNQYALGSDPTNGIGLYTNGSAPQGSQVATGFNFASGTAVSCTLTYDGTTLKISMTQGSSSFSHSWTINIPSTVGGSTAYAGFTGGTGGAASIAAVQSWTYTASQGQTPAVPAPPTNLQVK